MTFDPRDLLDFVPPSLRAECALALEEGRARAQGRELYSDHEPPRAPGEAIPRPRLDVPIHPEVPPQWWLDEVRAERRGQRASIDPSKRAGRRALERAMAMADGRVADLERAAYRDRQRAHQRTYRRRWRYLPTKGADDRDLGPSRPATAQQLTAARSAVSDEWGARAAVASFPVGVARRLTDWVESLGPSNAYGSPWSSRLVRRTVATAAAVLFASRPSWRPGYALVTTGFSRERLAAIIGAAPESGRRYSVSALASTEWGSLGILEALGIWHRQQLPGDAVPASDRGRAFAFNHYAVPAEMVGGSDQWGDPSRPNPTMPRELLERIAPWCVPGERLRERLAAARSAVLERELARLATEELPEPEPELALEDLVDDPKVAGVLRRWRPPDR